VRAVTLAQKAARAWGMPAGIERLLLEALLDWVRRPPDLVEGRL
jgi:hypothetical protein